LLYVQVTPYCGKLSEPSKFEELVNEVVLKDEKLYAKGSYYDDIGVTILLVGQTKMSSESASVGQLVIVLTVFHVSVTCCMHITCCINHNGI